MTREEAIKLLMMCNCDGCDMAEAARVAIESLEAFVWIPVTERLPEEDKEVLITYKGKGDELYKPYSNIDITTYGQMYFGGNKVGNHKHWRSPFQYFNDNYEVTAWMPLPEVYRGDRDEENN